MLMEHLYQQTDVKIPKHDISMQLKMFVQMVLGHHHNFLQLMGFSVAHQTKDL